jgi:hypothetical protein
LKILIIKLGAIGDIIHTLPALSAIRTRFPEAEVSWIAEKRSAEILRDNPLVNNLIEVDTRSMRGSGAVEKILTEGKKADKEPPAIPIRHRDRLSRPAEIGCDREALGSKETLGIFTSGPSRTRRTCFLYRYS